MSDKPDEFDVNSESLSGDSLDGVHDDELLDIVEEVEKATKPRKRRRKRRALDDHSEEGYELIRAALESHLIDYAKKKHDQKRNVEQLSSIIEEYLSSFILLGYNYDGESVTLVSANTQMQSDSLSTLLQKFIINTHPSSPGKSPFET
tara:strand:+ start:63 stop:506 length:444 start_codon:yes stop_codon:yes gene_type:complete